MSRIITSVHTTDATVTDTEMTKPIHQVLADRDPLPAEQIVDAGYVTAAHILTTRDEYGVDPLGPVGMDTNQSGHLPQSAFRIDWTAKTVTCPQGKASVSWSGQRKNSGTPITRVHFAARDCDQCPVRKECTKAADSNRPPKNGDSATVPEPESKPPSPKRCGTPAYAAVATPA